MIIIPLILAAASPADDVAKARKDYASCLTGYTNDMSGKKMSSDEFVTGLKAKCADKEAAFRTALMTADKADGMTASESAQDADDQVSEYVEKMTDDFTNGG